MKLISLRNRILSGLLACLMLGSCLASCRTTPGSEQETTGSTVEIPTETEKEPTDTSVGGGPLENLPYDPTLHPGDSTLYEGVLIHSVYGTGKKGAEALIPHGFVQLYNSTEKDIAMKGAALYYKTDDANPYEQFLFPEDAVIPAGGYYLVRANSPADFVAENAVLNVEHCDAEWDIYIDNKEVRLLLAPAGWSIGKDEDITVFNDANSIFVATMAHHESVYALYDLSRNKVAVRTALTDYSGYHTVNLTRAATPELRRLCTRTSRGEVNSVAASRLNEILFSHDAGIYTDPLQLTMSAREGYTIYYTTDGTDPSKSNNKSRKAYTGGITLGDTSAMGWGPLTRSWRHPQVSTQIGGHVIKAYATNGEESTDVFTNTYFITDDLEQYGVSIMSISMPSEEVVGSNGFYNNFLLNPGQITGGRHRGVGILEFFDPDGNRVGNSRVEMAVSGNGSSGWGMKSLRLYFKGLNNQDAGLQSDLNYDIFGGLAKDQHGQAITSFSRLMIRNSGNDCGASYIRDAYMQRVCGGLNVDIMASATTLVFINGEFWGVYNLRERYSPEYVESHYGVNKENVTVIESDYSQVHTNTNAPFVVSSGEEGDADPFNDMVQYMRDHDLAEQTHYDYITSLMDIDSFMDMWVTRLFFNARDWPENNIKVWRNKNPDDPSGFDTKWHFTLLDMDMGLSFFPSYDGNNTSENANFFGFFHSNSVCGTMMRALMRNDGFKQKFLLRYYEVVTEHLTPEYLSDEFEKLFAERDPLMSLQQGRWNCDGGFSIAIWQREVKHIRSFIANRQNYALTQFYAHFGVTEEDLESLTQQRIQISFHSGRVGVTINGDSVENGSILKMEDGETLNIRAEAKEGYTVTGISYVDRDGNEKSFNGTEATFTVSTSGSLSIFTKRIGQDSDSLGEGTLVAGATYLFYLTSDGDLYAWGDNRYGVLGLDVSNSLVRVPTYVMSGVAKVVTASANAYENGDATFATAILTTDGRLLTVGRNTCGQLGRNGQNDDYILGQVDFSGRISDVSMGHDHLLIVDEKGDLWGIGSNSYGALGSSNVGGNVTSFVKLDSKVAFASAGRRSSVYVKQDGTLWGLGDNRWNKMSGSHGEQIHSAVRIATDITFVDSGEHQILAVNESGKLYYAGWRTVQGFNQGGGNNPVFASLMDGVVEADIYFGNMVILTKNGDAYVYGLNTDNGIGDSPVTNGKPKKVLSGVADVAAGYGFTAYLMKDGTIRVQGDNSYGQAGNGQSGGIVNMAEADI